MLGVLVFWEGGGGSSESNKPHAAYKFAIWCKGVKGLCERSRSVVEQGMRWRRGRVLRESPAVFEEIEN